MRALIVYESMYGNTRAVAERIAAGLSERFEVTAVPVGEATVEMVDGVDLLVCGGPTHVHGMSRPSTRKAAVSAVVDKGADLSLEPDADGPGLRDWFPRVGHRLPLIAAAFDTRLDAPATITGRASRGIARQLRRYACRLVVPPQSFLVDKTNHLRSGQAQLAEAWGADLAAVAAPVTSVPSEPAS
jgi:hypothetical protein